MYNLELVTYKRKIFFLSKLYLFQCSYHKAFIGREAIWEKKAWDSHI